MKLALLNFLLFFFQLAFSQVTLEWKNTYHHISSVDTATEAKSMHIDKSGNVYVTGYSMNLNSHNEVITIKYDSSGNQLWMQEYDSSTNMFKAISTKILSDESGSCYVCGYQWFDSIGWSDVFLLKYDPFGNLIWKTVYGYLGSNVDDNPMDMQLGDSGKIYVTGYFRSNGSGNGYETLKFDSSGNIDWVTIDTINMNLTFNYCYSLSLDDSQNVFITGRKNFNDTAWAALIKYNKMGTKIWEKDFYVDPLFNGAEPKKVISRNQHVYVLTVNRDSSATWGGYVISKFDSNGDLIWNSAYRGDSTINEYPDPEDFVVAASENIYVTGGQFFGSCTIDKCVVVKFDSSGNIKWSRDYTSNDCNWDLGRSIAIDSFENVFTIGESGGGNYGTAEIQFCLSYDSAGNQRWVDRVIDSVITPFSRGLIIIPDGNNSIYAFGMMADTSGFGFLTLKYKESLNSVSDYLFQNSFFKVSPNPFINKLTLHLPEHPGENVILYVFNPIGSVVLEKVIRFEDQTIDLDQLPQGMYIICVMAGGKFYNQKILKL